MNTRLISEGNSEGKYKVQKCRKFEIVISKNRIIQKSKSSISYPRYDPSRPTSMCSWQQP